MTKRLVLIDGNSLMNRAFYAIPELTNEAGVHTNAVYGFINMLFKLLEDQTPGYIAVSFDLKGPTFRHEDYEDYKGTRKGMPDELAEQMPIVKEVLDALGISRLELQGFEADDLIGTVAKTAGAEGFEVMVVSGDKDLFQLVDDRITVLYTKRGISNLAVYDREAVKEDFGVYPERVTDFKGLSGDSSDNIPGIPGVGPKTALKFLDAFESVEEIVQRADEIDNKRHRNLVKEHAQQALVSKRLATIKVDVPLAFSFDDFAMGTLDVENSVDLFVRYGFKSLIPRLKNQADEEEVTEHPETETKHVTGDNLEVFVEKLREKGCYLKTVRDPDHLRDDRGVAIAFSIDEETYFYPVPEEGPHREILELMADERVEKRCLEAKQDHLFFRRYGTILRGVVFDLYIAAYLIDPARRSYALSDLAIESLGLSIVSEETLRGKGKGQKSYGELDGDDLAAFLAGELAVGRRLAETYEKTLKDQEQWSLYSEVELPLVSILAEIEWEGFNVNPEILERIGQELDEKIEKIEKTIYDEAGETFNINSPKQLGEILFERLGLPPIKKTKTGYSTAHAVLEKLQDKHPIISSIIDYRTYAKLKSTYIDGLFSVINPETGRIHTSLNQTVTVTGRLSSTEPNLQNIPIRLEEGREIRKVFIAGEGRKLVGADYSQIELRVLAHMSGDGELIRAFNEGVDIHTLTASQVFGVSLDEVTSLQRSRAKEVNFGISYGMSDYGLSQNLGITRKEAAEYIDAYFEKYPKVRVFMDRQIEMCKEEGFVKTLLNRRRYIPEINSKNFNLRASGERNAMNTPIQGSAADIIKLAMIRVAEALEREGLAAKLILQVHDELIIDAPEGEVEAVKELLVREMQGAYDLAVTMQVDVGVGDSWYEAK